MAETSSTVDAVVKRKVCCGCGACSVACPQACIEIVYGERFNYACVDPSDCTNCGRCLKVCPGAFLLSGMDPQYPDDGMSETNDHWRIYATDDSIRREAASGGFTTGLIIHMLEAGR